MDKHEFVLTFPGVSVAEGNQYAEDLRMVLLQADESAQVQRKRADEASQDFGATLVLVLGAPAVVALATAIGKWLARNNSVRLNIISQDGSIQATNLESKDVAAIVSALSRTPKKPA